VHILLVEDDDRVAAALRPALHRHGMDTTRLDSGRGVVDHLAGIDVVLLDLGLPDVDGVDVCRAIREVSEVPVIVVSARAEVDDRILGLHSGADD
jgi:DNA-binding response OmpR family regulator